MSLNVGRFVLFNGTVTASGVGSELNVPANFNAAIIHLHVSAASGTTPTLNVYVQDVLTPAAAGDAVLGQPSGTAAKVYDDFVSFTQATSTGDWVARVSQSAFTATGAVATVSLALQDATMSAGTGKVGPVGPIWRVKYAVTATTPSFTFSVVATLLDI